ncbi:hypothetical protein [Nocardioides sp.]|uniref:hypothetical protein n=1 Tax=Nocardioides sp. TaxID=35761 RepID=UPI003565EE05
MVTRSKHLTALLLGTGVAVVGLGLLEVLRRTAGDEVAGYAAVVLWLGLLGVVGHQVWRRVERTAAARKSDVVRGSGR